MSNSSLNDKKIVFINTKNKWKIESENAKLIQQVSFQRREAAKVSDGNSEVCQYCVKIFPDELMFCTSSCLRIFRFTRSRQTEKKKD